MQQQVSIAIKNRYGVPCTLFVLGELPLAKTRLTLKTTCNSLPLVIKRGGPRRGPSDSNEAYFQWGLSSLSQTKARMHNRPTENPTIQSALLNLKIVLLIFWKVVAY